MSAEERLGRAHDLGISAFLADTIYNFGELVRHGSYSLRYGFGSDLMYLLFYVAYAPDTGCVGQHTARVDQEAAVHLQRG